MTLNVATDRPLFVDADPQRLQQIVSNLLTNALKFTPECGSIDVRFQRVDGSAQIVVHDTGIGIAPDLLPRVFDRFRQGDSSTTRTHAGLGLGLAIVKHLVEQHGGEIAAASPGGGCGSTFTVTLPLLARETARMDSPVCSGESNVAFWIRVLVVDDDADARTTVDTILEQFGAVATIVASAGDALDAVYRDEPDVLLSDIAMPGQDGYTLIRRLRGLIDSTKLPAAALSGYVDGDSKAQALEAGFQAYLAKPVDPTLLARTLAALVDRQES